MRSDPIRHQQYLGFRSVAEALGFGRVRQADFRSRVTIDPAAQTAAADTEWRIKFLTDGDKPLAERTLEPAIASSNGGIAVPNEYMLCFRGVSIEFDQLLTTLDDTKVAEMCKKLGRSMLQIRNGVDVLFERRVGYLMTGLPAVDQAQGVLAAGAAGSIRHALTRMNEGDVFDDPPIIFPGASFAAELFSEGTWVGATPVTVDINLHGWVATQGKYAETAKVLGLAEAIAEAKSNLANLQRRAKVA